MVVEAVQNYVNMVNGLSKMTRDKALATARALLAHAGLEDVANDASERVSKLAEEIMLASRANRELVENLVAGEMDKAAARWGFVRTEDLESLRAEVGELRRSLIEATASGTGRTPPAKKGPSRKAPAPTPPVQGRSSGRAGSDTVPASQQPPLGGAPETSVADPVIDELVPSEPLPYQPGPIQPNAAPTPGGDPAAATTPSSSPAVKAPAKKAPAKKAPAKKASAKKTTAKKTPAKTTVAESLTPLSTFTPVGDGDAGE